ncbi:MAG: ABC transporter ATP-binding protein [Ilumatobacter sp.]|nr:ABC transporter ATP-binding protein [Ilumatobacter sp.]
MPATEPRERPAEQRGDVVHELPLAIVVDRADVRYTVYEEPHVSARKMVSRGFKTRRKIEVHAVKEVTFDVHVGEAVGIVGSNGSGKSSLLRSIAGLQSLASGSVRVRGEVSLLGVGAALKPSLSGYRNVMLGGLALGMSQAEIEDKMDEIVEFSGLGTAMARPMNTYSSGMRARLAFSISTLRVPDVLLIDEALAVGDKDFRAKSLERLREIQAQAGTIMMVTHNMNEIRETCDRALWLDDGVLIADGPAADVIEQYESRS